MQDLNTPMPHSEIATVTFEPDLVIEETKSSLSFLLLVVLATLFALTLLTVWMFLDDLTSSTFRLFILPCYFYYGFHQLAQLLCRFRLRKHRYSTKFLSSPPMSRHKLLQHVAARSTLMEMVSAHNSLRTTPPEGFPALSMLKVLFGWSVAAFLVIAGTMLFRGAVTTSLVLQAASAIPIMLFSAFAIARIRPGFKLYGLGSPSSHSEEPRDTFEAVRRATIEWDHVLGVSYLSLEADGETTRFYNPTEDPLYLLRLLKFKRAAGTS